MTEPICQTFSEGGGGGDAQGHVHLLLVPHIVRVLHRAAVPLPQVREQQRRALHREPALAVPQHPLQGHRALQHRRGDLVPTLLGRPAVVTEPERLRVSKGVVAVAWRQRQDHVRLRLEAVLAGARRRHVEAAVFRQTDRGRGFRGRAHRRTEIAIAVRYARRRQHRRCLRPGWRFGETGTSPLERICFAQPCPRHVDVIARSAVQAW